MLVPPNPFGSVLRLPIRVIGGHVYQLTGVRLNRQASFATTNPTMTLLDTPCRVVLGNSRGPESRPALDAT